VRVDYLTKHLIQHHKDKGSKRAMAILLGKRNRMLKYLLQEDREMYRKVCTELKVGPWKQLMRTLEGGADATA
jgi:small subunit ribosomal protein S15